MVHLVPGSGPTIRAQGAVEIGPYWGPRGVLLIGEFSHLDGSQIGKWSLQHAKANPRPGKWQGPRC